MHVVKQVRQTLSDQLSSDVHQNEENFNVKEWINILLTVETCFIWDQ